MALPTKKHSKYALAFSALKLGGYVVVPLVLLALPADFFDKGQSVCVSKWLFDLECWGCGMTRALMHLIHFEWAAAWDFNSRVFIVFPLLAYVWAGWAWKEWCTFRRLRASA